MKYIILALSSLLSLTQAEKVEYDVYSCDRYHDTVVTNKIEYILNSDEELIFLHNINSNYNSYEVFLNDTIYSIYNDTIIMVDTDPEYINNYLVDFEITPHHTYKFYKKALLSKDFQQKDSSSFSIHIWSDPDNSEYRKYKFKIENDIVVESIEEYNIEGESDYKVKRFDNFSQSKTALSKEEITKKYGHLRNLPIKKYKNLIDTFPDKIQYTINGTDSFEYNISDKPYTFAMLTFYGCPPCMKAKKAFTSEMTEEEKENFVIFSIDDPTEENLKRDSLYDAANDIELNQVYIDYANSGLMAENFSFPAFYLVDNKSNIIYATNGYGDSLFINTFRPKIDSIINSNK